MKKVSSDGKHFAVYSLEVATFLSKQNDFCNFAKTKSVHHSIPDHKREVVAAGWSRSCW
jgi:hypothetical protein